MITLYTFGPMFGLPDPSPFCVKVDVLLKMSGQGYRHDYSGFLKAPKGKLPYIKDDGETIADSTFIRWHLERKYRVDFDAGLTAEQRAVSWAFEKLCEDNLYWAVARDRWLVGGNFDKGPRKFFDFVPALVRPLIIAKSLREVRRNLHGQGLGRHSVAEGERLAIVGINAIADFLGDKPFLMGDTPCAADATVFASGAGLLCPVFDGPLHQAAKSRLNLVAYRDRGMARWYPDFKGV